MTGQGRQQGSHHKSSIAPQSIQSSESDQLQFGCIERGRNLSASLLIKG